MADGSHGQHADDVQKVLIKVDALVGDLAILVNQAERLRVLCALAAGGSQNMHAQNGIDMAEAFRTHLGVAMETLGEVGRAFTEYRGQI